MIKTMLAVFIGASALVFVPQPVAASSCADAYTRCLNDSYHYDDAMIILADIDCFAEYVGCVREKILKF